MHRCRASASVLVVEIDTFVIGRGVEADASAVADVWLRSFTAALPSVHRAHTDQQVRAWFRDTVLPTHEVWVAAVEDSVVGMMVLHGGELSPLSQTDVRHPE